MKRLSTDDIRRIKQLRRVGYPMATIAKIYGVDRSVIAYHTNNLPKMKLEDFLKAILPHTPIEGPPLPREYSPSWKELGQLLKEAELEKQEI